MEVSDQGNSVNFRAEILEDYEIVPSAEGKSGLSPVLQVSLIIHT
jgi:hypothetical protein